MKCELRFIMGSYVLDVPERHFKIQSEEKKIGRELHKIKADPLSLFKKFAVMRSVGHYDKNCEFLSLDIPDEQVYELLDRWRKE